jgi:hypothetical protein
MGWLAGLLGFTVAVVAIRRFLKQRYWEMYGSEEPEYKEPPIAPDLGWPGGRI